MAFNLVTNFEVALIKKLWQCSVHSRTLRVAVPSPPPPHLVGGGGYGVLRLAAIRDQWRRVIAAQIEEKPEPK